MDLRTLTLIAFAVCTTLLLLVSLRLVEPALAADLRGGSAAKRLLRVGQVLGVFLVAAAAVKNAFAPSEDATFAASDVGHVAVVTLAFGALGLALLVATGKLGVRMLLAARLGAELERGNVAAGLAAGAHYVASGIIISVALGGENLAGAGLSVGFFLVAMVTLHGAVGLFRALTTYDDAEQIAGENLAAAISYAGLTLAVSIVVARAVEGDFVDWMTSLKGYGKVLLSLIAFYPVRQVFVGSLLLHAPLKLRGGVLDAGIAADRNVGLGALEAASYVATALSIVHLA